MPAAPPKLYKYISVETARAVLTNGTLRWSTPKTFNDPFDMQLPLVLEVDDDEVIILALEKIEKVFSDDNFAPINLAGTLLALMKAKGARFSREEVKDNFEDGLRESMVRLRAYLPKFNDEMINELSKSKILCLSESPLISTMWSHYADEHRGVVLEFGTPAEVDSPWKLARAVEYRTAPPNFADVDLLANVLVGTANFGVRATVDLYEYSKSAEWEYEREWRISSGNGRSSEVDFEDVPFHRQELMGVIFGYRATNDIVTEFSNLARAANPVVSFRHIERAGINLTLR